MKKGRSLGRHEVEPPKELQILLLVICPWPLLDAMYSWIVIAPWTVGSLLWWSLCRAVRAALLQEKSALGSGVQNRRKPRSTTGPPSNDRANQYTPTEQREGASAEASLAAAFPDNPKIKPLRKRHIADAPGETPAEFQVFLHRGWFLPLMPPLLS